MLRLAAILGGLVGVLLVPLALAAPTSLLLLPAHLAFCALASAAAIGEGLAARPERARLRGAWSLVATIGMVAALQLGSGVDGVLITGNRDGLTIQSTEVAALGPNTEVQAFSIGFAPSGGPEYVTIKGFRIGDAVGCASGNGRRLSLHPSANPDIPPGVSYTIPR